MANFTVAVPSGHPQLQRVTARWDQLQEFGRYVEQLQNDYLNRDGGVLVRLPSEVLQDLMEGFDKERKKASDVRVGILQQNFQPVPREENCFHHYVEEVEPMTLSGYSTYCAQQAYSGRMELHEIKEDYFRRLATFDIGTPGVKYGADQANTDLFKCTSIFELNDVHTILKGTSLEEVPGLVRKYGYFGCYGSSFAAHVENALLYSANLHMYGWPKLWDVWPASQFEEVALFCKDHLLGSDLRSHVRKCPFPMSHKGDIFPSFRVEGGSLGVQCFGDLMITAPAATHMGFNTGENYCEAVNFGNRFWLSYVKDRMDAGTYPECSYKHKKNCQSITPTPADFQKWENVEHFDSILTKRFARGPRNCQPSSTMCSKCNKIIVGEHYISKETGKPLCSSCREKERMLDRLCSRCNTVRLTKKNRRRVSQEKGSRYICTSCHDAIHKRGTGDKNPKRGRSRSPTPQPEPSRMGTRSSGATSC